MAQAHNMPEAATLVQLQLVPQLHTRLAGWALPSSCCRLCCRSTRARWRPTLSWQGMWTSGPWQVCPGLQLLGAGYPQGCIQPYAAAVLPLCTSCLVAAQQHMPGTKGQSPVPLLCCPFSYVQEPGTCSAAHAVQLCGPLPGNRCRRREPSCCWLWPCLCRQLPLH